MRLLSVLFALAAASAALAAGVPGEGVSRTPGKARLEGRRALVLLEDASQLATHSQLLQQLREVGLEADVRLATGPHVQLHKYGEWQFDVIAFLCPSHDEPGGLMVEDVVAFLDGGGSVFMAASPDVSAFYQDVAGECGVEYDAPGSAVIDHVAYDAKLDVAGDHTTVITTHVLPAPHVTGAAAPGDAIVYRGIGQAFDPSNYMAFTVLSASPTAYSAFVDQVVGDYPQSAGTDTSLITAVQLRNNARATFAGSLYMFSDAAMEATVTPAPGHDREPTPQTAANRALSAGIVAWTTQRSGVLRTTAVRHFHADGRRPETQAAQGRDGEEEGNALPRSMFPEAELAPASPLYCINDDVTYEVDVMVLREGEWVGYTADDMQVEFVMMEPYIRRTLTSAGYGTFATSFRVPDKYGVYTFRVMYRRTGWSTIHEATTVAVRPRRHTEEPRFMPIAYPYYASWASVLVAFFALSTVLLFAVPPTGNTKPKTD